MRRYLMVVSLILAAFGGGCVMSFDSGVEVTAGAVGVPKYRVTPGNSKVTVTHDDGVVSVMKTKLPEIEEYDVSGDQSRIVVKSRAAHGPARVEMFDISSGERTDSIWAYEIKNGQPSWARGMEE